MYCPMRTPASHSNAIVACIDSNPLQSVLDNPVSDLSPIETLKFFKLRPGVIARNSISYDLCRSTLNHGFPEDLV